MRAPRLGGRDRRALVLALVLLGPLLLYVAAVRPYLRALGEVRARTAAERALLERELALFDEARRYPAALERTEARIGAEVPRLFGSEPFAATAALAEHVAEQALHNRVLVQQSETREPGTGGDGLLELRVDLRASGDLRGILGFLRALETGDKLVRVDRLAIERSGRYGTAEATAGEALVLTATVHGYAVPPEPDPAADPGTDAEPAPGGGT